VEPFVGSACLFFHLEPEAALLGDSNAALINAYLQVRDRVDSVLASLRQLPFGERAYYRIRDSAPEESTTAEHAAYFIYLNRFCFNGIYRTNKAGRFNVPYGGAKSGALPTDAELLSVSRLLARAKFVAADFTGTLAHCKSGDFVYLDPPYHSSASRVFSDYTADGFTDKDVLRLRNCLKLLDQQGVAFALSYAENEEGELLSAGFRKDTLTVRRNVAGFTGSRRLATEILVTNIS
jgi:DNA adenine methylase